MKTQKILALFMAVVMVFGLCTTAFAATGEKVQINNMMVDTGKCAVASGTIAMPVSDTVNSVSAETTSVSTVFVPIKELSVDWNSNVTVVESTNALTYNMVLFGATAADFARRTLTVEFTDNDSVSNVNVSINGVTFSGQMGSSMNRTVTLQSTQIMNISWTETQNGVSSQKTATATLNVTTATGSVELIDDNEAGEKYGLTIAGYQASQNTPSSVGGVTRYSYTATLPANTATTVLDAATVVATPKSNTATMTLKNADGTDATTNVSYDTDHVYTFANVNFNNGTKTLTVTDGNSSREYEVSASISGQSITVHLAIRTYLAYEWINGSTTYYDYVTAGYGSGVGGDYNDILSVLQELDDCEDPVLPTVVNGKPVFAATEYTNVTLTAGSSVMDALVAYAADKGIELDGADNNYISAIGTGSGMVGEFDCGYASGWMYTVRTTNSDTTSALPNVGASEKIVTNGQYIDWYYTAAYGSDFGYSIFDL